MTKARIDLPGEIWKPAPGFHGRYEVSNMGRVWSVYNGHYRTGRIVRCRITKLGYVDVILKDGPRNKHRTVHSLIAEAFHGPRPDGHNAAHLDGVRTNCRADNLAWVTPTENHAHKKLHGTQTGGFNHPPSKIMPAHVLEIRRRTAAGESHRSIAADLGFGREAVRLTAIGALHGDYRPDTIVRR